MRGLHAQVLPEMRIGVLLHALKFVGSFPFSNLTEAEESAIQELYDLYPRAKGEHLQPRPLCLRTLSWLHP